ncbi:MAG: HD domain-containing protein [Chloroflexi bacterium]|nr:MAG: HD domain-containing protein [Chloroflexota bacterium]
MTDSPKVIEKSIDEAEGHAVNAQVRAIIQELGDETPLITVEQVAVDPQVIAFLKAANRQLDALGYTEHGERHANLVAHIAYNILDRLGYPERMCHLAAIAGYLHDSGNLIHREMHAQSSAIIAMQVLDRLGMSYDEIALVMGAIGNHEEERGDLTSPIAAAVIIADKSDVHRSRVQETDPLKYDIHDRVNFAATRSFVRVNGENRTITLELDIDTSVAGIMEYFEIFIDRMVMARRAAEFLGTEFELVINNVRLF